LSVTQRKRIVSENRVPSKILGCTREEVAGIWRRLRNKKLHNLYASPNIGVITPRMKWTIRAAYKMYFKEIGWEDEKWIHLAQDRDR